MNSPTAFNSHELVFGGRFLEEKTDWEGKKIEFT